MQTGHEKAEMYLFTIYNISLKLSNEAGFLVCKRNSAATILCGSVVYFTLWGRCVVYTTTRGKIVYWKWRKCVILYRHRKKNNKNENKHKTQGGNQNDFIMDLHRSKHYSRGSCNLRILQTYHKNLNSKQQRRDKYERDTLPVGRGRFPGQKAILQIFILNKRAKEKR